MKKYIEIRNARIHNLKGIDVKIPKNRLTLITGVSGSGKSSLAFDTLYEEGKKRYLMFSGTQLMVEKENTVDEILGLSPTVAVEQRIIRQSNPRSTVGTRTQIEVILASLFANFGITDPGYETEEPMALGMFQKNSPRGMCPKCSGKGYYYQIDMDKLILDRNVRVDSLLSDICNNGTMWRWMEKYRRTFKKPTDITFAQMSEDDLDEMMFGTGPHYPGMAKMIVDAYHWGQNTKTNVWTRKIDCVEKHFCKRCEGTGLGKEVAHTRIGGKTITELSHMYLGELATFLQNLPGEKTPLHKELIKKVECLNSVGLHHLSLDRTMPSLSGGEVQRLFLASYILAEMDSIVFIFDEPTIGLHEIEKQNLIDIIRKLIQAGNTVVCVEHDEGFMRAADYIIDIGPDAGILGGFKIYEGGYAEFLRCKGSKTVPYLLENKFPIKREYRTVDANETITIRKASLHNLKDITVEIPLGIMIGVAGVSGSGKSSLISDTLVPLLKYIMSNECVTSEDELGEPSAEEQDDLFGDTETATEETELPNAFTSIENTEKIKKCFVIDQKPIGRSKTSCPATYTGIMDRVRKLFAETPRAKELGLKTGNFTVNSKGGCRFCKGEGSIHYHVGWGNFIDIKCERCGGYGFVPETMSVLLDGKNIRDVLEMSVDEAVAFFADKDAQTEKICRTLQRVGMGYMTLGQKTPTISGGESQRIKLAKELAKGKTAKNYLYILDEPTTGLSMHDSQNLLALLDELVDQGNTVIITEHDVNMLSNCDWIIEMGPEGGRKGGYVIAEGTPRDLKKNRKSMIGQFLK